MKMKTIIRQNIEGELLVNTLPYDSDTGITHKIFYPELKIDDNIIVGFGFTDIPEELKGFPVIVIEGEGNTEAYIFDGLFMIIKRMSDVLAALVYYSDLDYDTFREEVELYHPLIQLMLKYCTVYHSETTFTNMEVYNYKVEGDFPYKLLWRADDYSTEAFKLPSEKRLVNPDALEIAKRIPVLDIKDKFKMSYGASPSIEEAGSKFYMVMEFNKSHITIPDMIWALDKIITHAIETISNIIEPNQEARFYASMIFLTLSKNAKMMVSGGCEQ